MRQDEIPPLPELHTRKKFTSNPTTRFTKTDYQIRNSSSSDGKLYTLPTITITAHSIANSSSGGSVHVIGEDIHESGVRAFCSTFFHALRNTYTDYRQTYIQTTTLYITLSASLRFCLLFSSSLVCMYKTQITADWGKCK